MVSKQVSQRAYDWVFKGRACGWTIAISVLLAISSCDSSDDSESQRTGAAAIHVGASALSAADITRLVITVSGDGISPDIVVELTEAPADHWSGTIDEIPAGSNRSFLAEAFDNDGALVYSGTADGITIGGGEVVSVSLFLQQTESPVPFDNAVPVITRLTVSPLSVAPGDSVSLIVGATDANPGDALSFLWEADAGVFSNAGTASTTWTAPTTDGSHTVTVSVGDPHGAIATASVAILVSDTGTADIDIAVNTSPEVLGLVPTPTRITDGESTDLALTVVDSESDPMSFSWSADCDGTFDDDTAEDPVFTLNSHAEDTCTLTVVATDDAGGSNQASIRIETDDPVTPTDIVLPSCDGVIEFPDPALAAAVYDRLDMAPGDVYYEDLAPLHSFSAFSSDIADLTGIHCMTNLTDLYLSRTHVSDLSPLSALANLGYLVLDHNNISDISPLTELTNLYLVALTANNVSDISILSGLGDMEYLFLNENNVSDLSAVSGLTNLFLLDVRSNNIDDLSPLLLNAGLGAGDTVRIGDNPLDCDDPTTQSAITELQDRGIDLVHDCE